MKENASIKWYLNRLTAMPFDEIKLRLKRKIAEPFVRRAIIKEKLPASPAEILNFSNTLIGCQPVPPNEIKFSEQYINTLINTADEICKGKISLFNKSINLDNPVNWYRDYAHNINCPKLKSNKLNYRNPKQVGDIMYIWWLNRHQHLTPVALAFFATGNQKYSDFVINQLQSWLDDCKYPMGPAWLTGIEAGVRLITWMWIYRFLFAKGRPQNCSDDFLAAFLLSIKKHVRFIDTHWAKFSSANNHTIAEAVGILAATDTFPQLFPGEKFAERANKILLTEIKKQISSDGVDLEQAVSYHAFVLELLINACHFSPCVKSKILSTISKMANFLDALLDDNGNVPDIGDADNAVATGIIQRSKSYYTEIADVARSISNISEINSLKIISKNTHLYCGTEIINKPPAKSQFFECGGYAVWKTKLKNDLNIHLCMYLSELGYGKIAAHGHADSLSFTLYVNGEPVFIDPGTYAYHDEKKWRDYFRSTRAHNTLVINNLNQADILGPFLWSNKYFVHVYHAVLSEDQLDIKAEHDGYFREEMTLAHKRQLAWHPMLEKWIVRDELVGNGEFDAELFFHIHPDRKIVKEKFNVFKIYGTGYVVSIKFSSHFYCRVAKGETDPPLGWFSPVLGKKIPSPTIHAKGKVIGFDNIFTEIFIQKLSS